jgi:thiol-disulfide isomerase/thioredoxin
MKRFMQQVLAAAAVAALGWVAPAQAVEVKPYDAAAVAAAVEAGQTVVLDFHADWCGTCRKQASVLAGLAGDAELANVTVFKVDFDAAKELKAQYKVKKQSTMVMIGAEGEIARLAGQTSLKAIRSFLAKDA